MPQESSWALILSASEVRIKLDQSGIEGNNFRFLGFLQ